MRKKYIPALLAALFLFPVLSPQLSAEGLFSSEQTSQERKLDSFDRIELDGSADLFITFGGEQKVTVRADKDQLDKVVTENVGRRRLLIETDHYRSRVDIEIEITVPELKRLSLFGSGNVEVVNIDGKYFDLLVEGSGDVILEGKVEELEITVDGSGDVDASDLTAEDVYVEINGSGDVDVYAEETIYSSVNGSGDVKVHGSPKNEIQTHDDRRSSPYLWRYNAVPAIPSIPAIPALPSMPVMPKIPRMPKIVIPDINVEDIEIPDIDVDKIRTRTKRRVWY
ncbi:MAG: DUF2807 domain-containing protein [candidate division Zixibacteria bacterium]|nr:DUF2807 domain-containing protein [candidate division Zixibacteria bacterium]